MDHEHGYEGITPANPDGTVDERPIVPAFIVFIGPDGRAVGDGNVEEVLTQIRVAPVSLRDMWRLANEVAVDCLLTMQGERLINMQMQMAGQIQQQAQTQALLQGIDLKTGAKVPGPR